MNLIMRLVLLYALLVPALRAQELATDPDVAPIVTGDIDRFWQVFDAGDGTLTAKALRVGYLQPGTQGLKDFTKLRIESAKKLANTVTERKDYYLAIRPYTQRIQDMEMEIRQYYRKFKELYPEAVFPAAYFVIGRMNSGGTFGPKTILIGAEMYGDTTTTPPAKASFTALTATVIHELVHYQQRYQGPFWLTGQVIKEGAADFIATLVMGEDPAAHRLDYFAKPREREIWQKFLSEKDATGWKSYDGWLYSPGDRLFPGAPNDLGYWLGFQICSAYYAKAEDKKQAIADILNIKDFAAFVAASGYNP